jgi:hypothetical protein
MITSPRNRGDVGSAASPEIFEVFGPKPDPPAEVTAEEVRREIAAELELSEAPNVIRQVEDFIRRYAILPDAAYLPLATLAVATYLADVFDAFPYVAFLSPTKGCGKTRMLELLELMCSKAWRGTFPTAAALYRMMAKIPTLLLDEVEALRGRQVSEVSQAILAVLNAGYRKGATVPRCDGPNHDLKFFPVYGPKVFAAIGGLPGTLADRSICITMQRKTAAQSVQRFLQSRAEAETAPIRESLKAWAETNRRTVRAVYVKTDDLGFLADREAELWMPLFAICAVAAPDRVRELKESAQALTGAKGADDVEDSLPLKLLADVRNVCAARSAHMLTAALLEALKGIPESPWGEPGHELTARKLARMLHPFGVESRSVRVGDETGKGYSRVDFEEAFSRYLRCSCTQSVTSVTTRMNTGENANFGNVTEASCDG